MELFEDTRLKIGYSILSKKSVRVKRKVFYSNISLVKTIGIVWDSAKTEDFSSLSRFYQKMHDRNIDVKIIGYYPGKELPDQYTALRYLSCIRKKETNMFYIPVSTETDVFIKTRFDILIDINFGKLFTLWYITSLSSASFKVGLFDPESDSSNFDLMMEIKKPVQVENYLTQVIHYLEMINATSAIQVEK
ncbi:MAG: hypothetical protein MUC93_03545 [Bacteroidales bacterium]|jgi:hypothetical protein|nr:hypothetical protein [Bacteroidales bacterium]